MKRVFAVLFLLSGFGVLFGQVTEHQGDDPAQKVSSFTLVKSQLVSGGTVRSSGNGFELSASIGPFAGRSEEGRWLLISGFWATQPIFTNIDSLATGVEIPKSYELQQNYPNPFNPQTTIEFGLPVASQVEIAIYNILGQRVVTLVNEYVQPGRYSLLWDGKAANDQAVASGMYIYHIIAKGTDGRQFAQSKKMILQK